MLIDRLLFKNKTIFITGATGTIGGGILRYIVQNFYDSLKEIRILSRDEYKLAKLMDEFRMFSKISPRMGDIRDFDTLRKYLSGVDIVVHSAALKRVEFGEYYPYELFRTNVEGTRNIVEACIENSVGSAILISTDKAVEPSTTYGATKLCSEKIFVSANIDDRNNFKTKFSVVRLGNVVNSRGSIFEIVKEKKLRGEPVFITDKNMTRFWITIEEASRFVVKVLSIMEGGEIFIPKMQATRVLDVVKIIYPDAEIIETKPRPGEKIHEKLISDYEKRICFEDEDCFIVYPDIIEERRPSNTTYLKNLKKVDSEYSFSSRDYVTVKVSEFFEDV